jgi:hypothetical protein
MRNTYFFIFLFISCGQTIKLDNSEKDCLPDNLFVATGLKQSMILEDFKHDKHWDYFYKKKRLIALDSLQKTKLLEPFVQWFPAYQYIAHFVSKQDKIGEFQPIILRVVGTDYLTLWLLLLDNECKPVSVFYLEGKNCEGPWETDSTIMDCPIKRNKFKGNKIDSYEIRKTDFLNTDKSIIDSLVYATEISEKGEFKTKRIDSVRYVRRRKR